MHGNSTRRLVVASGGDQVVPCRTARSWGLCRPVGTRKCALICDPAPGRAHAAARPGQGARPVDAHARRWRRELCGHRAPTRSKRSSSGRRRRTRRCFSAFHEITPEARDTSWAGRSPKCAHRCGDVRPPPRVRRQWSSTSMPHSSRSTPSPRRRRARATRADGDTTRCSASPMPPAKRSLDCCVRATPGPTRWPTT